MLARKRVDAALTPSPQVLSRGKRALSTSNTSSPRWARWKAALQPAGPAPTTMTSWLEGPGGWVGVGWVAKVKRSSWWPETRDASAIPGPPVERERLETQVGDDLVVGEDAKAIRAQTAFVEPPQRFGRDGLRNVMDVPLSVVQVPVLRGVDPAKQCQALEVIGGAIVNPARLRGLPRSLRARHAVSMAHLGSGGTRATRDKPHTPRAPTPNRTTVRSCSWTSLHTSHAVSRQLSTRVDGPEPSGGT